MKQLKKIVNVFYFQLIIKECFQPYFLLKIKSFNKEKKRKLFYRKHDIMKLIEYRRVIGKNDFDNVKERNMHRKISKAQKNT